MGGVEVAGLIFGVGLMVAFRAMLRAGRAVVIHRILGLWGYYNRLGNRFRPSLKKRNEGLIQ